MVLLFSITEGAACKSVYLCRMPDRSVWTYGSRTLAFENGTFTLLNRMHMFVCLQSCCLRLL
jgi:hypothetical protein